MQQYNKTKRIKGIVNLYSEALRFRDMITKIAQERMRILAFWEKHGDAAAREAFKVSRSTLFRWRKMLKQGKGRLEAINPGSTAPKTKRKRVIPEAVKNLIIKERSREKIGKEKLAILIFAFAFAYTSHSSKSAADFMKNFKNVAPFCLSHVQTDNGSEFRDHFEIYCEKERVIHFHAYPKTPKMQSEIERFNRTLSEAFISKNRHLLAYDIEEFNRRLADWLLWYNIRRPHWSIVLISPLRYICDKLTTEKSQMLWTSTGG